MKHRAGAPIPTDPSELATRAATTDSEDERNRCLEALRPTVTLLSEQLASRLQGGVRDEFLAEAFTHVGMAITKGRYLSAKGRFETWCRPVLMNLARTWIRRSQRSRIAWAVGGEGGAEPGYTPEPHLGGESEDAVLLASSMKELQEVLRATGPALDEHSRVGRRAVLLARLRLAVLGVLAEGEMGAENEHLDVSERWTGWDEAERNLCFRPGWPTLGEIWKALRLRLSGAQPETFVDHLAATIEGLSSEGAVRLTPDLWYQWVKRAKERLRKEVSPAVWERLFGRWLDAGRAVEPGAPAAAQKEEAG